MQISTATGQTINPKQSLPFRWDLSFPRSDGAAEYLVDLPPYTATADKIEGSYAVFIPRIGNQIQVYLNGNLMDAPNILADPLSNNSKQPYWLTLPTVLLLTAQPNRLLIKTTVQALRWGGMSELYYGPAQKLRSRYEMSFWWQYSSHIVIFGSLFLSGLLCAAIWFKRRDRLMGLFALSAFCGSFSAISQLGITSWLPWPMQGFTASVAFAWHIIFVTQFTFNFAGHETRWARLILFATALAIGLAFVLAEPFFWTLAMTLLAIVIVIGFIFTATLLKQKQLLQVKLLFSVSLLVALTGLRDLFFFQIPEAGMSHYPIMPHALFLYLVVMWWVLTQRSIANNKFGAELNIRLEHRAVEREQQLSTSFEQIQAQVEERAKLEERQRIMSDIHDGVGGQLVGLVNMIKRGENDRLLFNQAQLSEHAQMVLDELRIAVDAMQPVDGDLTTVLATLRYRLAPRLKASDVELIWQIDELPIMAELSPQKVLQIQRILFEAFTNIMQHAKAKTVTVRANHLPEMMAVKITIEDDGVGFAPQYLKSKGHGLRNMRNRANAIGALITIQRLNAKGVTVTLTIPLV